MKFFSKKDKNSKQVETENEYIFLGQHVFISSLTTPSMFIVMSQVVLLQLKSIIYNFKVLCIFKTGINCVMQLV